MKLNLKRLNRFCIILIVIVSAFVCSGCVTRIKPITKFENKELPKEIPGPLYLTMYVDTKSPIGMWGYSFVDSGSDVMSFYWPQAHSAFSKVVPELYSDTSSTIPIIIKITVDDNYNRSFWSSFPFALLHVSSATILPYFKKIKRQFSVSVQLSPGKYSDPVIITCEEQDITGLIIVGILRPLFSEKNGWKSGSLFDQGKQIHFTREVNIGNGRKMKWSAGNWSYRYFLYEENENFIKMISDGVVECLNQLNSKETNLVLNNPEAWKCYQELNPFAKSHFNGGEHSVTVDVTSEEVKLIKANIVETEYNESTCKGSVVIIAGNTDRVLLLKWLRNDVLPGLLGTDKAIKILSEETLPDMKIKFKFQVVE